MDILKLQGELEAIIEDLLAKFADQIVAGDLLVLGCSTSEVQGHYIGKGSSAEIGQMIIQVLLAKLADKELNLAVQCCEHLNRALVIERKVADQRNYPIVNVKPALNAGGAAAVAAMEQFEDPVLVEYILADGGIDIGDTFIGMHIRHVQVPVRPENKSLGYAHVTAVKSRPKYIGGPRAQY